MSAVGDDEYESSDDDDELSSSSGEDESSDESSSGTSDSDDDNDNQAKDQTDDDLAKAKAVADDVAAIKRLANDMQKIYLRLKYRHDRPKESAVMTAPLSPKPEEHEELPSTEPVSKPLRPHPLEIPTEPSTIRFTKTDAATDSDDLHLPPTVPAVASLVKLPFEDVLSKSIESKHSNVLAKGQIDIECKLQMELKHTTPLHLLQYMLGTPQVKTDDATSTNKGEMKAPCQWTSPHQKTSHCQLMRRQTSQHTQVRQRMTLW
ncbi:hypothetical protein DYB28_008811 [Aphanomyces astaci]|uniref:Uncharacterized protein n=1 Tax=Aphanomyces astaci TaxID=112090 RepID=A0A9X8HAL7_APHAT|nr:hypothetical protein DYB28_008811 [Aphanomyces astaci]